MAQVVSTEERRGGDNLVCPVQTGLEQGFPPHPVLVDVVNGDDGVIHHHPDSQY